MTFAVRPIGLVKTGFVWRPTISADVTNWVLYSQAIAAGWDGVTPLDAVVTVSSGIVLSADSTSLYGFDTGSGFPVGTSLKLIMPGYVCGMGGAGGATNTAGSNGGPALRAQHAITIDALGGVTAGGGGGGGRSGRTDAAGGVASSTGANGTFSSGGAGGSGGGAGGTTGPGGAGSISAGGGGGGWGASGGTASSNAGGTGGAAVVGNSYITWINTGTRYGSIT